MERLQTGRETANVISSVYVCIIALHPDFTSHPNDPFAPVLFVVKNGKNGKPHVLQLQNKEDDGLQFDLAAGTLEELFEWYKVSWDITQRAMSQQYNREQEASRLSHFPRHRWQ